MNITKIITSKPDLRKDIINLLLSEFSIVQHLAESIYDNNLIQHFNKIIDSVWILIEVPYIDKVYRDSYYNYFSTKLARYHRDSIRLSFFDQEIKNDEFQKVTEIERLSKSYLGFIVLRPTEPRIVGRSVLSPRALKINNFLSLKVSVDATVNSIKFKAVGFPHASQDTETISCAETTIWALMEYFGNKYAEYKPVLPSRIINVLKQITTERQVPSVGLNVQQIAFTLKEFGFGTKIYSRQEFGDHTFNRVLSTYIESGIPLILAVENRSAGGNISHAIITIGHEVVSDSQIDALPASLGLDNTIQGLLTSKNIVLYDNDDINKAFVFIDDNQPAYQLATLDHPTAHYPEVAWQSCNITYFVSPLYPKIYLEAYKAKSYFLSILFNLFPSIPDNSEIFIRFFLSSSRSFKQELALKSDFNQTIKDLILETQMPKFVWIGEISSKVLIKNKQADGLILLDATEANMLFVKVIISAAYQNSYIFYDPNIKWIKISSLPLGTFSIFTSNLNGY